MMGRASPWDSIMRARLTLESGGEPAEYDLDPVTPITLGRSRENTVVLLDELASRRHACVYCEQGRWFVRDLDSLNGTYLDGERLTAPAPLADGARLRIGDVVFRARLPRPEAGPNGAAPTAAIEAPAPPPAEEEEGSSATIMLADELTSLCRFMTKAVGDSDPRELLRRALRVVIRQTKASLAGYMALDVSDPLPKVVLPDDARVDAHLSRQLTQRVQQQGRAVWLGTDLANTRPTDSLMPFTDAMCLPVRAAGPPFGALHVYRTGSFFTERDVRFSEAVVGYLGNNLQTLRARRTLEFENSRLRSHLPAADELVGDSPALRELRERVRRAAAQSATVLIQGESGVGKELVATALHRQSRRADGPMVPVNCAAIQQSMLEAELFGYRKGAFTGADRDYPGLFQMADEGTLFLDEVGELSADCQAKLLRVIEGKSFRPLGTTKEVKTDVRVLAATNRDLAKEVKAGRFRDDLYFRLNVITIRVPPLREHLQDIPALVEHFLRKLSVECRRPLKLTAAALQKLRGYHWPGNVRQLGAVLQSAAAMTDSEQIDAQALLLPDDSGSGLHLPLNLESLEKWAIGEALKRSGGNKTQAAKMLGVVRDTLSNKLEKYGLTVKE
jgi:two-component system, NtrC family, response regulator HydG